MSQEHKISAIARQFRTARSSVIFWRTGLRTKPARCGNRIEMENRPLSGSLRLDDGETGS